MRELLNIDKKATTEKSVPFKTLKLRADISADVLQNLFNCHLFMNSDNSDYIIFHINYDPPGEYQFVNHVVYVTRRYKGVVLDKWLHKSISLLAINK